jgi:hypothetical protein
MQMIPKELGHQLEGAHRSGSLEACVERVEPVNTSVLDHEAEEHQLECSELARVKSFCSSILKTLTPPLLSGFERTTGLRADAEPFTPK